MSRESRDLLRALSALEKMPLSDAPELLRTLSGQGYVSLRLASGGTVAVITDAGRAALEVYDRTERAEKRADISLLLSSVALIVSIAALIAQCIR